MVGAESLLGVNGKKQVAGGISGGGGGFSLGLKVSHSR